MFHIDINIDSLPCLKNENVQILIFFYKQNELIRVQVVYSKPTTIDGIHTLWSLKT